MDDEHAAAQRMTQTCRNQAPYKEQEWMMYMPQHKE